MPPNKRPRWAEGVGAMYTVKRTEDQLWTVGEIYKETFNPVSDHSSLQEAEDEAIRLNGGTPERDYKKLYETVYKLLDRIDELNQRIEALEEKEQERDTAEALGFSVELYSRR